MNLMDAWAANCIKFGEDMRQLSALTTLFYISYLFLHFETRVAQRQVGSKTEAQFRTFAPPLCKISGRVGDISEWKKEVKMPN